MSRNEILVHPRVEEASGGRHGSSSPTLYLSDTRTKEYMLARDGAPAKSGLNHIVLDIGYYMDWPNLKFHVWAEQQSEANSTCRQARLD